MFMNEQIAVLNVKEKIIFIFFPIYLVFYGSEDEAQVLLKSSNLVRSSLHAISRAKWTACAIWQENSEIAMRNAQTYFPLQTLLENPCAIFPTPSPAAHSFLI